MFNLYTDYFMFFFFCNKIKLVNIIYICHVESMACSGEDLIINSSNGLNHAAVLNANES